MNILKYELVLEAEQPIAHHAENFGNESIAMRRRIRQADGTFADVPIVTGDTMRHGLREAGTNAYLDAAGLLGAGALSEAALRLLYAGGALSGKGDASTASLDAYRQIVELVPLVAIFGGCAGNRAIPGRLQVEEATLVCDEAKRWIPSWALEVAVETTTARAHVEEVQRVRMDPMLDPAKRLMLVAGDAVKVTAQFAASEKASKTGDAVARDENKSSMMPRRFERVCQGSLFFWRVQATCMNPLDIDTFLTALAAFLYAPVVGGKRGTGHGKLRVVSARNVEVLRHADRMETVNVTDLGHRAGALFRAHVLERKDRIKTFLQSVDA